MPIALSSPALGTASRFGAAILGGYAFAYGLVPLATLAGFGAGMSLEDAASLAWMLSLLAYLVALCWGFAARSVARAWLVLGGGGAAMGAAAWALSRLIV